VQPFPYVYLHAKSFSSQTDPCLSVNCNTQTIWSKIPALVGRKVYISSPCSTLKLLQYSSLKYCIIHYRLSHRHTFFILPEIWLKLRGCSIETLSVPLLLVWLSVYANNHWSVTEPEAIMVLGWQTGTEALCLYCQSTQACKPNHRTPTLLTTALIEWNALHTILAPWVGQALRLSQCPHWAQKSCSCHFPPEQSLLRITKCYTHKGQNLFRLFI